MITRLHLLKNKVKKHIIL